MVSLRTAHPFPARMAPELALNVLRRLPQGSVVVDPMCGSGTVLRYAQDLGHTAIGADMDPLAVLMARVWTRHVPAEAALLEAERLTDQALKLDPKVTHLPWLDSDKETASFVQFWFAERQANDLRRLSYLLRSMKSDVADLLRLALSRIIVTKDRGATLARDVSHSRPHKVADDNDFDAMAGFLQAVSKVLAALSSEPKIPARVLMEDARVLCGVGSGSVDCVLTSPPYLNAIDYLRGHRLSLVWLGYKIGELRQIRSASIGAERKPDSIEARSSIKSLAETLPWYAELDSRHQGIFDRYLLDLMGSTRQVARILKPEGVAVFVIGNSTVRGSYVENSEALKMVAQEEGLTLVQESQREIPPSSRYLPPPSENEPSCLAKRMRKEVILEFRRAA